jgi:hypothetical protein
MKKLFLLLLIGCATAQNIAAKARTDARTPRNEVPKHENWGFFGHQRINRMAVFTLPPEMIGFYKQNIEYITAHAVDPDKRRYATKLEAFRHYIDADHWGVAPFPNLPRRWTEALLR